MRANVLADNKNSIYSDLESLAYLLVSNGICKDPSPIYTAAARCLSSSDNNFWQYKIEDLVFEIGQMGHSIPRGACLIKAIFSINLKGRYYNIKSICNPLTDIELNLELIGSSSDTKTQDDLYSAWHFDRHQFDDNNVTKFIHPEFHFTFGGRRMWDKTLDYGSSLILPSPRFTHPPLDGILGIDFVIQNYLENSVHIKLTQSQEYRRILYNSQCRMWRPYHCAIANHWKDFDNSLDNTISTMSLLPNLI